MTQTTLTPWPSGASDQAISTRWLAWFARYINAQDERRRRQRGRRAWAGLERRSLDDIGVSPAQRFIAINTPFEEY